MLIAQFAVDFVTKRAKKQNVNENEKQQYSAKGTIIHK